MTYLPTKFKSPDPIVADSSSPALLITQAGSGDALRVEDSANPDATPFVVDTNGNVGIGTATPAQKLSVTGVIESTTGGIKFPDGTIQTTASTGGGGGIPSVITANSTTPALRITQIGTGDALLVEDSANPDATPFRVDTNGNAWAGGNVVISEVVQAKQFASSRSDANGFQDVNINYSPVSAQISLVSASFTAAPSFRQIVFNEDNYGREAIIHHADNGTLTLSTNPFAPIILDPGSSGVGIGTTAPAGKLHVTANSTTPALRITQTGTGDALVVEDSANPDLYPFRVDQFGNMYVANTLNVGTDPTIGGKSHGIIGNTTFVVNSLNATVGISGGFAGEYQSLITFTDAGDGGAEISYIGANGGVFPSNSSYNLYELRIGAHGNIRLAADSVITDCALIMKGPLHAPIVLTTAAEFSILNHHTIGLGATIGTQTARLPSAVSAGGGIYTIKRRANGATSYTVAAQAGQTIDGATTYALTALNSFVTVQSDGANWWIIAKG